MLLLFASCGRQERTDQGRTSACWIYAMCACIEHEALLCGDSVALSRQWLMARELQQQAEELFLARNNGDNTRSRNNGDELRAQNNTDGKGLPAMDYITMRGVGPEVLRLIDEYGLVPYSFEETMINNSRVAERKLSLLVEQTRDITTLRKRMRELLPDFSIASPLPEEGWGGNSTSFFYYSMRYTPQQFAESIMYRLHYDWYAYSKKYPIGTKFVLDERDNYRRHRYQNADMETMLAKVMESLRQGHAVYWEYGKNHASSHAMAIVGLRKGKDGKDRLLCLNSYGSRWGEKGYCTVGLDSFRELTCNVGVVKIEN